MKIAIVYQSITGNTKMIADTIKKSLENYNVVYFGKPTNNINADIYIVGSWTDKGDCSKEIANFLTTLNNKKILYFGTAGFGGSKEYYNKLFARVKEKISDSNEILGYFYCQGKMPSNVREKYIDMIKTNPEDKQMQVNIENFDKALTHPNKTDLQNIEIWIREIIK